MALKIIALLSLIKLFTTTVTIVSSAPIPEALELDEKTHHVVRINASIGENCNQEETGGNDGGLMTGVTVVVLGETPWSVNQELVNESRCPEPLSSLCTSDDGLSYTSPFFEGDIVLGTSTRRMIEESRAARREENQDGRPEETGNTDNEDQHQEEDDGGRQRPYVVTSVVSGGNHRVVIISSSTSHKTGTQLNRGYGFSRTVGGSHVRHHHSRTYSSSSSRRTKRALVKPKEFRWKNGIIPFTIDDNLPDDYKTVIRMGMRHWERRTCVQFVAKTDKKTDYLRFAFYPGCWSFIGKQGGEQILSVGFTCNTMRTVVHEIGHAVGLWHEQSRRDRDKYIKVVKANIAPGTEENFQKIDIENITSLGYPYDFDSVMHYDALAFTKNGAPTMKVRKEYRDIPSTELGMKDRLSDLDIAQVNAMYECNQKKPLSEECFQSEAGKGEEYRGEINYTDDFITCQKWTAQWPNKHEQYSSKPRKNERNGLGEHNFCRNPDSKRKKPWCFTNHKKIRWQYCPIKLC